MRWQWKSDLREFGYAFIETKAWQWLWAENCYYLSWFKLLGVWIAQNT